LTLQRRITLTLDDDDDMLSVGIHDDGRGFDPAGVRSRPAAALRARAPPAATPKSPPHPA
jgi:signal transduction histidine kinase